MSSYILQTSNITSSKPAHQSVRLHIGLLLIFGLWALSTSYLSARAEERTSASKPGFAKLAAREHEARSLWTTSRIVGSPEPPPPYTFKRVFSHLKFNQPAQLTLGPARQRFFLTEYTGRVVSFLANQDATDTDPFLELKLNLHSIEFHPQFDTNRYVYVFGNNAPQQKEGTVPHNQLLRFEVTEDEPPRAIPESQTIILEYDSNGHNGGEAKFGPDGYLYITSGDGTGDSDQWNSGQDVNDLPASMLRIDVDHPDTGRAYGIPEDNPFVDLENARGELWAYGFRNPWRFSFDKQTGNLYVGDVGQDLWEMIYLVRPGGNYGWSVQEGGHDFHPYKKTGPTPIMPPLIVHHHTESRSITGGHVYRGSQLPKLQGAYIYGDYETGKIWGLRHDGKQVTWHEELADTVLKPSAFAIGMGGEFYLVAHQLGEIYELVSAPKLAEQRPFPRRLSDTGLFTSTEQLIPAPGLIPYSVNAPQWCDGAKAERYIGLPGESQITFSDSVSWQFPEGAVLVKTLQLPAQQTTLVLSGNNNHRRLETQILTLQAGQWHGYSYVWNDQQTDAELAPSAGINLDLATNEQADADSDQLQSWRVTSRTECMVCHSRAAGFVLGLQTGQMNLDFPYSKRTDNQLHAIEHLQVFTKPLPASPDKLPRLADPYNDEADLSSRVRAYLHANCSHCHVGAGGGNAKIVLTEQTKLAETFLVGGRPLHADFGIAGAMLLAPGDPQRSILYQRISRRGNGRMPPLATNRVDQQAAKLVYDWIKQIEVPKSAQQDVDRAIAELQGETGTLARWQVAGPFDTALDIDTIEKFASVQDDDSPSEDGGAGDDDPIAWRRVIGAGAQCRVTLGASSAKLEPVWLARSDVILAEPGEVQLLAVSSGKIRVWLNSQLLVAQPLAKQGGADENSRSHRFDARMQKGCNRLLVEIKSAISDTSVFHLNFRRKSPNARHEQLIEAALTRIGDAEFGKKLFLDEKKVQCIKCHRVGHEGPAVGADVGPDLAGVGGRLSTMRIIESMLEPSRTVAPNYRRYAIELADGRFRSGIKVGEADISVTIMDDQAQQWVISKNEIAKMQNQPTSLMPEGLEKSITTDEFVDLVTYLKGLTASSIETDRLPRNTVKERR